MFFFSFETIRNNCQNLMGYHKNFNKFALSFLKRASSGLHFKSGNLHCKTFDFAKKKNTGNSPES